MERLTDNTDYCTSWSDCEMPEGKCVFLENCYDRQIYNKLREYEDIEEQGLLLRLPCKEGTEVFALDRYFLFGEVGDKPESHYRIVNEKFKLNMRGYFGKTVFLTKEEAEAALKEMEK